MAGDTHSSCPPLLAGSTRSQPPISALWEPLRGLLALETLTGHILSPMLSFHLIRFKLVEMTVQKENFGAERSQCWIY